jgi:hypothetical protein
VRRVPAPASQTWRYDIRNETGNWTGEIVLDRGGGGWTGRMRSDQIGTRVELRNVQVSASELRFDIPDSAQVYQGRRLPGGRVVGTFTWSGQNWDWAAVETTVSSLR